jgi:hypothetical protein
MSVVYSIPLSEEHVVETYAQHRTQQKALLWLAWPMKVICALGLLGLLALGVFAKIYFLVGFAAFFLALLAVGPRFDYWYMRRRWKRHPQFNELLRIEVSDSGMSFVTPRSTGTARWDVYTKAVARPAGVLLYSGNWDYYWLPDKAIAQGTAVEVRELLRTKVQVQNAV